MSKLSVFLICFWIALFSLKAGLFFGEKKGVQKSGLIITCSKAFGVE
jgi:hypothetical protein